MKIYRRFAVLHSLILIFLVTSTGTREKKNISLINTQLDNIKLYHNC